jgi:hypothetical protein
MVQTETEPASAAMPPAALTAWVCTFLVERAATPTSPVASTSAALPM